MDINNIKERAEYYVPESLESEVKRGDYNQYFIEASGVYEVAHAEMDDPRVTDAITADVEMLDGHGLSVDVNQGSIENIEEFAFDMGVPFEEINPGFNENGEYVNDVSYGELADAQDALPGKIMDYAERNNVAVLPIYQAENDRLSTEPETHNYHLAGFISEPVGKNQSIEDVRNDLREQVEMIDAIQFGDVYKVTQIVPSSKTRVEDQLVFGSDPDTNGLSDIVHFDNFLGHFENLDAIYVGNDPSKLVDNEYNRVNGKDRYALEPKYDARDSFYGKARVEQKDFVKTLYSYDTPVLALNTRDRSLTRLIDDISTTTARHMKEFLLQENVDVDKMKGKSITAKLGTIPGRDYGENVKAVRMVHDALEQGKDVTKGREKSQNEPNR